MTKNLRTTPACARMHGSPNADTTIPVVKKIESSLQAVLVESISAPKRRAISIGTGARK